MDLGWWLFADDALTKGARLRAPARIPIRGRDGAEVERRDGTLHRGARVLRAVRRAAVQRDHAPHGEIAARAGPRSRELRPRQSHQRGARFPPRRRPSPRSRRFRTMEWSLPAVYDVVASAVPERDVLVWKQTRRSYREVAARTRGFAAYPRRARHRHATRARRTGTMGVRPVARGAAPAQLPRVHRGDARLLPRPRRSVQCQPPLPARRGARPARHGRPRGRRLSPRARAAARRRTRRASSRCSSTSATSPRRHASRAARRSRMRSVRKARDEFASGHVARRPLHGVHGRHHGLAEGRAVAAGRHLRVGDGGSEDATVETLRGLRCAVAGTWFAAPPLMHAAAQWTAFAGIHSGATIVLHDDAQPFDARTILETASRERVNLISIVGDAYAAPDHRRAPPRTHTTSASLQRIATGGATTSEATKQALFELLPDVTIIDGYGASETGGMAFGARRHGDPSAGFAPGRGRGRALGGSQPRLLEPGDEEIGWTARRGRVPLGYLGDPTLTEDDLPDRRRRTARRARRPGDARRRRHHTHARTRLHGRQHGRREGVRGGGRSRAPPAPRRRRRLGRRPRRAIASARRSSRSCSSDRGATTSPSELREFAARFIGAVQGAARDRVLRHDRPPPERQARLPVGARARPNAR